MAIEKRHTLGEVTGTLGDIVRRKRFGKIVVSSRPSRYRKSKSRQAVEGRNSFALSVAFAKAVNSIPELKQVWQLAKLEGVVAYNRVIKYNKQFIKDSSLTLNNIISPTGVNLLLPEFQLTGSSLSLKIDLKENDLRQLLGYPFFLHIVIYAYSPVPAEKKPFVVLNQSGIVNQEPENGFYILDLPLASSILQYLKRYKSAVVYAAASNYKGNKKEIFWTSTSAKQFDI